MVTILAQYLGHDVVLAIQESSDEMLMALLESGANVTVPTQVCMYGLMYNSVHIRISCVFAKWCVIMV